MTSKIVVPTLGESVAGATVSRWLKHEGEPVHAGEIVVELETDKVNLEVAAVKVGILGHIAHKEGEDVKVGDVLGTIDEAEQTPAESQPTPAKADAPEEPPSAKEPYQADVSVKPPAAERPAQPEAVTKPEIAKEAARATSLAQRIAAEQAVDLAQVTGSGPGGRVTKENVEQYVAERAALDGGAAQPAAPEVKPPETAPAAEAPEAEPRPSMTKAVLAVEARREQRQRLSRRRQTIARRLVEAQHTAAMLTTFNEIDMSAVVEIRKRRNPAFAERHDIKLGFMSFFVKASIVALKAYPRLNSELQGDELILKHYYDIGVAIGAEEGLVVPVLRDADRMSFAEIEIGIDTYVRKSREGTLSLADLRGGSFTITNGGVFGSLWSTPILNPPQAAILGIHKIEDRPVVRDGSVLIRPMMYVALSYDHRIVDGREAVQFLVRVKELVEDPESLLLEG